MIKKIIVDYDGDPSDGYQYLRDAETGRRVDDLGYLDDARIHGVFRGENEQLIFEVDVVEDEEDE